MTTIEPGIYDAMPEDQYHGHKESLSVSGAKKLLPPSCPAIFKHERDHGQPHKAAFDFGHAAHAKVLGVGADVEVVQVTAKDGTKSNAEDYRTKSAQEHRDAIRAGGKTPLLAHEVAQVNGMAAALKSHDLAMQLLDPDHGKPEQSGFWFDQDWGVMRRLRFDFLRDVNDDGTLVVVDYKSCASAEPAAIAKAVENYRYHMQDDWYSEGARALDLADDVLFAFIFQEKTAPYVVTVVELDDAAKAQGRRLNEQALGTYADCMATDTWPPYSTELTRIALPAWATRGAAA